MKKLLSIVTILIMMILTSTVVKATTSATLADELYALGAKYGMTSADKIKIERYVADNTVTDAQANAVVAKAKEAVKIMEDAGKTNINSLTNEELKPMKQQVYLV